MNTTRSQVTPETEPGLWRVLRLDDNGNSFEIARGLPRSKAQAIIRELEDRGHKQCYWSELSADFQSA